MPPRLTLRVDLGPGQSVGPGKIRLLEAVAESGSISSAGRDLGMSYRRAWMLIEQMNQSFRRKVVSTQLGGSHGGGAKLTPFGAELVKRYRTIEEKASAAAKTQIDFLAKASRAEAAATPAKRTRLSR